MSQCAKIKAGLVANFGSVFIKKFANVFLPFSTFITFLKLIWTLITFMSETEPIPEEELCKNGTDKSIEKNAEFSILC